MHLKWLIATNNLAIRIPSIIATGVFSIVVPDYSEFAQRLGYTMSTTQQYDPYENAIAERINGILKYEYGLRHTLPNLTTAKQMVKQAVDIYNTKRIHYSLGMKTPDEVHQSFNQQPYKSYAKQVDSM